MSLKKSALVLSVLAALYGCDDSSDSNNTDGSTNQAGHSDIVTNPDANEHGIIEYTARIFGEKKGSLKLTEENGSTVLTGLTDGQHVWIYEPEIPANTTLDQITFNVDAEFDGAIEYQVNIYLIIDGVSHKADIMVNRQNRLEDANVILYIDELEPVPNADPKHHWVDTGEEFANFEEFQAAYGHAIVQNQQHHFDDLDGTTHQLQGNFYLKFGNHNYEGHNDVFKVFNWFFKVDGATNHGNDVGTAVCNMNLSEDHVLGGTVPSNDEAGALVGETTGKHVWAYESNIQSEQKLAETDFCANVEFNDQHFVNVYFTEGDVEYKADVIMHLPGNPIAVFKDTGTEGVSNWEKVGEDVASWQDLQALYPTATLDQQEMTYTHIDGSEETINGNFFLSVGNGAYVGSEEYRIVSWNAGVESDNTGSDSVVEDIPSIDTPDNLPEIENPDLIEETTPVIDTADLMEEVTEANK